MSQQVKQRLQALRELMKREKLDAYIVLGNDAHNSEYVPDYWKTREWLSGFSGSAGSLVVTLHDAALWTDSRYFLSANAELQNTGITLMKERVQGTPSIPQWIVEMIGEKRNPEVGIDGFTTPHSTVVELKQELTRRAGITLRTNWEPFSTLWNDRPLFPHSPVFIHPIQYAGTSSADKLALLRTLLSDKGCDGMFVAALDDIAWTLNLRGSDVHCNPVFVAYLLITQHQTTLFIYAHKLTNEVKSYLEQLNVEVKSYDMVQETLKQYAEYNILMNPNEINHTLFQAVSCKHILQENTPIASLKAVKNEVEIEGFKRAMERDGVAMVRFLRWLKPAVEQGTETECSVAERLKAFRAEQPLFVGNSFDTIAGYQAHGAIVHYEANKDTDVPLKPEGFLLLDSGAHYFDGTTDITRTIALGALTNEQRHVYTLVLKGHIQLAMCKFPQGATGTQLDIMARAAMWREGMNYGHGTGHGVGSFLNVHEGPHQIRMEYKPAPFVSGMTVTNEPGLYLENRFGVRIENVLLTKPYIHSDFGMFLQFEDLTLCPIETEPIKLNLLTDEEKEWLNNYHKEVYNRLQGYLTDDEKQWLERQTAPVG